MVQTWSQQCKNRSRYVCVRGGDVDSSCIFHTRLELVDLSSDQRLVGNLYFLFHFCCAGIFFPQERQAVRLRPFEWTCVHFPRRFADVPGVNWRWKKSLLRDRRDASPPSLTVGWKLSDGCSPFPDTRSLRRALDTVHRCGQPANTEGLGEGNDQLLAWLSTPSCLACRVPPTPTPWPGVCLAPILCVRVSVCVHVRNLAAAATSLTSAPRLSDEIFN